MAALLKSKISFATGAAAPRSRVVRVSCQAQGESPSQYLAAACLAATLMASAGPAEAGVQFQNQPQLKKLFQDDAPAAQPQAPRELRALVPGGQRSAPSPAAAATRSNEVSASTGGLDLRTVALPGAIVGIAGLAFVATKVDNGVEEWFNEVIVRDSNNYAGYEPLLKTTPGAVPRPKNKTSQPRPIKAGTGPIKPSAKKFTFNIGNGKGTAKVSAIENKK